MYTIPESSLPISGELRVPGSKSITNRSLIAAALAEGKTVLRNALFSDDTIYLMEALSHLGLSVNAKPEEQLVLVEGSILNLPPKTEAQNIFVGNAGTAMRFLTALLCQIPGEFTLTGTARMKERPLGELISALLMLGGDLYSVEGNDCPPVHIRGARLGGGKVSFSGNISSQFISALMLAAPLASGDVHIHIENEPVSRPYLEMTGAVMASFGTECQTDETCQNITIPSGQKYRSPGNYQVEGDASSASYFFAAAAVSGGRVRIPGTIRNGLQGDMAFLDLLEKMGCGVNNGEDWTEVQGPETLKAIEADMRQISDTALTMACLAPFAEGKTRIYGVENMRFKETDRIRAMSTELRKLGVSVEEHDDGWTIEGAAATKAATIETYDDHRIAMSFAVAGLRIPGLQILDPRCTSKTYPGFFSDLEKLAGWPPVQPGF